MLRRPGYSGRYNQQAKAAKRGFSLDFKNTLSLPPFLTFSCASTRRWWVNGALQVFSANTPRLINNLGIVMEGGSTNLANYSNDFSNAAWSVFGATVGADAADSVFGTGYKRGVVNDTGASLGNTRQAITVANDSGTYTVTGITEKGTSDIHAQSMQFSGGTDKHGGVVYSGTDGSKTDITTFAGVAATGTPTSTVENMTGNIYRTRTTMANNAMGNTTLTPRFYPSPASTVVGTIGNSQTGTEYLHYVGVEKMPFGTSPIITTGTSGTRADEFLSIFDLKRKNFIRNSTMQGAAVGVAPTNWLIAAGFGIAMDVVGAGSDYIDVRIYGTGSSSGAITIRAEGGTTVIPAANGQYWNHAANLTLVGGSMTGIGSLRCGVLFRDSGGSALADTGLNGTDIAGSVTAVEDRFGYTHQITHASTAYICPMLRVGISSGVAIDATIRIRKPQLERRPLSTSTSTAYIPTYGSAEEVWDNPIHFVKTQGTLIIKGIIHGDTGSDQYLWMISDGGTSNYISARVLTGSLNVRFGITGSTFVNTSNAITIGQEFTLAITWDGANIRACLNGGTVATSVGVPPDVVQMDLLGQSTSSNKAYGVLAALSYENNAVSATTLQGKRL